MHTYKTLVQLEKEASEQNLDHVLSHPFFAKKSSLQQEDSHDREHEGSSTMNDYDSEVKGAGKPVDKIKYKKKPKENTAAAVAQQKNAHAANDIDEKELEEGNFQLDVGTTVAMKDKRNKMLYGKVAELEKVSGKPGVVVRWSDGKSGRFQMSAFASLMRDRKADYIVSEESAPLKPFSSTIVEGIQYDRYMRAHGKKPNTKEAATWVFTTVNMGKDPDFGDSSKVWLTRSPMKLAQAGKEAMKALKTKEVYVMEKLTPEQTEIIEACMCQDQTPRVDGRTKAYRETYSRIMDRIKQVEERKKKSCGESWEQA